MPATPVTDEIGSFLAQHPDTRVIELLVPDTNGIFRGKRIERHLLEKAGSEGVCLPGSLFGMDITGTTVEETGLGFDEGDADRLCWPVPGTLSVVPWQARPTAQMLLAMYENDGRPFFADPRHVLDGVLAQFRDAGLVPVVALEMEFYLIDLERTPDGTPQPPRSPVTAERERSTQVYGMRELDEYRRVLEAIEDAAARQHIPGDTAVSEYAPGQYEINLQHQDDALRACDHAILLKHLIKNVVRSQGMDVTFMAKPYTDLAGSGMHIHVSVVDEAGNNIFQGTDAKGSDRLRHAVGGLLAAMAESMALFAPNANSFRRFQEGAFVPTSPDWGYNNRTTALRIPAGSDSAKRVEHRVPGADANPYLLTAAVLAGIHHGLAEALEPVAATAGNAYPQRAGGLPLTWLRALERFREGRILPAYLNADFRRVYIASKNHERQVFNRCVTALEYEWYLRTV